MVVIMSLIGSLKNGLDARKIFGQRELKIIEKQLLGVNLTQSEKNRLSRDIRKKLEFIKEISRYEKEFKLKKGSEIKRLVKITVNEVLSDTLRKKIKKIVLFGSVVENRLRLQSDIDISVEFDDIDITQATNFRKRLLGKISERIDLQVYNVLPEKVKKDIDEKGKVLYDKNE